MTQINRNIFTGTALIPLAEHFDLSMLENSIRATANAITELQSQIEAQEGKYRLVYIKNTIADLASLNNFLEDNFNILKEFRFCEEVKEF